MSHNTAARRALSTVQGFSLRKSDKNHQFFRKIKGRLRASYIDFTGSPSSKMHKTKLLKTL